LWRRCEVAGEGLGVPAGAWEQVGVRVVRPQGGGFLRAGSRWRGCFGARPRLGEVLRGAGPSDSGHSRRCARYAAAAVFDLLCAGAGGLSGHLRGPSWAGLGAEAHYPLAQPGCAVTGWAVRDPMARWRLALAPEGLLLARLRVSSPRAHVRRHASSARRVRQRSPLPPLRRSFADALMKRGQSPSPSESPPLQHPHRVRAVSPRPAAPEPYRPPARRRSPIPRSLSRLSGRASDRASDRRASPARRDAAPPPPRAAPGRREESHGRGHARSPPHRSPRARSPGSRARSPGHRGPSPEARRQELALREELLQRPLQGSRPVQDSWRHDRVLREPVQGHSRPEQLGAAGSAAAKKKKNKKRKKGPAGGMGGNQSGFPPAPPTGARPQEEGMVPREKTATTNTCFNCGVVGHFCSDCTEPEQCILCGDVSHLAMACTARYRCKAWETLEFLGHAIDGGFYYLDMGGAEPSVPRHLAVISVLPTQDPSLAIEITAEIIRTELAQLECDCVWNVREVSPFEFAMAFCLLSSFGLCLGVRRLFSRSTTSRFLSSLCVWTRR
jgi:hypothetical protein